MAAYDYDLGDYSRPVTTDSDEAQAWFDRGLVWTYAYHHEEAIECFKKALAVDPRRGQERIAAALWSAERLGGGRMERLGGGIEAQGQ